jgi:hypothetical protein
MKRVLIGLFFASSLALPIAACDDGSWGGVSYVGGGGSETLCGGYSSCGACTPVSGCGWCTAPNGSGVCSSDPDNCPTEEFSWTWDPKGCRVVAEASVELPDATSGETDGNVAEATAPGETSIDSASDTGCKRLGDASVADASPCD